jgi:hypothetical protein
MLLTARQGTGAVFGSSRLNSSTKVSAHELADDGVMKVVSSDSRSVVHYA